MFRSLFAWLLNKGLFKSAMIVNIIGYCILAVAMAILDWWHKHH